jgi:hypothetical protein
MFTASFRYVPAARVLLAGDQPHPLKAGAAEAGVANASVPRHAARPAATAVRARTIVVNLFRMAKPLFALGKRPGWPGAACVGIELERWRWQERL